MSSLQYVGVPPSQSKDIMPRSDTDDILNSGISRSYVNGRVIELAASKATQTYVNTQDGLYAEKAYFQSQDATLVDLSKKGIASGIATIGSNGLIPDSQLPFLGGGVILGPFGPTTVTTGSGTNTPFKIATFSPTYPGLGMQAVAFLVVGCKSTNGRPVIEVRISDSTVTDYASQKTIAMGVGRDFYNDYQIVTVRPATPSAGQTTQPASPVTTSPLITVWAYDLYGASGGVTQVDTGFIYTGALYFLRTQA